MLFKLDHFCHERFWLTFISGLGWNKQFFLNQRYYCEENVLMVYKRWYFLEKPRHVCKKKDMILASESKRIKNVKTYCDNDKIKRQNNLGMLT